MLQINKNSAEPLFSVVIVNYNGGQFLQNCLDSLAAQTVRDFEVILVDNDSEDGSIDALHTAELPAFQLMAQSENLGFAKGNNIAAEVARGKWLVLLNPDAEALPDWLEQLRAATLRHPQSKAFASIQYSLEDETLLDGAGDAYLVFGLPWRGGFQRSISEIPDEGECFSPCGAGALYDRQLFLDLDGFDERFFCYCEDVDLGFRMQLEGYNCIFVPQAAIKHAGSAISGRHSYFSMYHGHRNRTWTYLKNMPLLMLILTMPAHIAMVGYFYIRNVKRLEHTGLQDGLRDGLKHGWSMRRSPEYRTNRRPKSYASLLRQMAWNPFRMTAHKTLVRPLRKPVVSTATEYTDREEEIRTP